MPLYEYECKQCGRRTEKIQKFSDAPLTECPHCGGPMERLVHAPAVAFKGGGWYADLYSSSKRAGGGEKSDSGAAKNSGDGAAAPASPAAPASTPAASSTPSTPSSSPASDKK